MTDVRTRFAPSPTGYLHIGGVRTALFNWLFARQHGGQFILRIDDTDQSRNIDEALGPILHGFRWLGMDWDEGPEVGGPHEPYYQSRRNEKYQQAVDQLLESGHAYRDYALPEEIEAEREKARAAKQNYVYDRRFMASSPEDCARFEAEGRAGLVRLKMPREGKVVIEDRVRGEVEIQWSTEPDHVIQRADGSFIYHLANVVDDHDFRISHVIRAEEHLPNTARQIFIAQSLGYPLPVYAHIPFVAEPGSKVKLSKRKLDKYLKNRDFKQLNDHGVTVMQKLGKQTDSSLFNPVITDFFEQSGFLPDAIVNYLLLLGWSLDDKTEFFSRQEMIEKFSLERVVRGAASFNPLKLEAFQQHYMNLLDRKKKVALCLPFLQKADLVSDPPPCEISDYLGKIVDAAGDRIQIAGDILEFDDFFREAVDLVYDEKAFEKRINKTDDAVPLLAQLRAVLESLETFEAEEIEKAIKDFVEKRQIKIGQIIHALRIATTGKAVGFGTFDTLSILGKDRCLQRIDQTLQKAATANGNS
ncbi:MAG: glutamate--tRNA ligase [Planctomycetota bacterium]|nr:glutamate--tRNA ligase [Planctomycetota bacterium]